VGLSLSLLFVRDTTGHARHEQALVRAPADGAPVGRPKRLFTLVSWHDPALASVSQAGLVNNLNDGIAWGLFPLYYAAAGLSVRSIGVLASAYPMAWGISQLATGALSDRIGRKWLIAGGMAVQGIALIAMTATTVFAAWLAWAITLGVGTAMVYPTLLAVVGDVAGPGWRGSAVGIYRWWRDLGYVVGAVAGGILADRFGIGVALGTVGLVTIGSGLIVAVRMPETLPRVGLERHGGAHGL
jgi:MFS family permease